MLQKINQFSFSDAEIFIKLRKESLKNSWEFLMTYEDEEQNFTAKWYVEWWYLRNYYFIVFEILNLLNNGILFSENIIT